MLKLPSNMRTIINAKCGQRNSREIASLLHDLSGEDAADRGRTCRLDRARGEELLELKKFRWELRALAGVDRREREDLIRQDEVEMNGLWAREDQRT